LQKEGNTMSLKPLTMALALTACLAFPAAA